MDLSGKWKVDIGDGKQYDAAFPGTLDTNHIGGPDKENLDNRFTRVYIYEGAAQFQREIEVSSLNAAGKRVFLEVERARCLSLKVNGEEVAESGKGTLSTPYVFEITDNIAKTRELGKEEMELSLLSDNSYPDMPRQGIITSSAATNETQTNWNGMIGYIRIREEETCFIDCLRIYPKGQTADIELVVDAGEEYQGCIHIESEAFGQTGAIDVLMQKGERRTFALKGIPLAENIKIWDEGEGNLYPVRAVAEGMDTKTVTFGVRDFSVNDKFRLTINQRVFFLRGEANCAVFPETGYPPMTVPEWEKVLGIYASYGVNCMRFHSWCPPEAAFIAADKMGMMMQPELSHWDWDNAFGTGESMEYYKKELCQVLHFLANHPSFVMLSFGNELWSQDIGERNKEELLDFAREFDPTRLYAGSSNGHYGQWGTDPKSDFYTSHDYKELHLRGASTENQGHINQQYPNAKTNYNEGVAKVHEEGKPVFGFEVGQFEVLPDFGEIESFQGVTRCINYLLIKDKVEKSGRLKHWEKWVEATGEISLLAYREEVEAALRTEGMSGLSLLGLQDFPGQGTAIVGMLNSHLEAKPYDFARPERFREFFAPVLPLLYLDKYTYWNTETLSAEIMLANYGKCDVSGEAYWKIYDGEEVIAGGRLEAGVYPREGLRKVGLLRQDLIFIDSPRQLTIEVTVGSEGTCREEGYRNTYHIWVYPRQPEIASHEQQEEYWYTAGNGQKLRIASALDEETQLWLAQGGRVYLEPQPVRENLPSSIGGQFTTDFWSVGTFPAQEGGMGMVIDTSHPIFADFPTQKHTNWQWWQMAGGRPIILPEHVIPILTVPDSYSRLKHMGLLFEAKAGGGTVIMSGMGLRFYQQYPESLSLLHSIMEYLASEICIPAQEISMEELKGLVRGQIQPAEQELAAERMK